MSISDWIASFGLVFSAAGVYALVETWRISRKESADKRVQDKKEAAEIRIHEAEKKNVLESISTLAEVMKEFRLTQKEQEKNTQELKVAVAELKVNVDFLKEQFSRGEIIKTADGWIYNFDKVNKQK